jgi:hypothetical protein
MTAPLHLVELHGPGNQSIYVSPIEVVGFRAPRALLAGNIKCLIQTVDGKFIAVIEDCNTVKQKLEQ